MKKIFTFCFLLLCISCSVKKPIYKIGVDPDFYPLNFGDLSKNVSGFVDELLLEISKTEGVEFQRIEANWDVLFEGLHGTENKDAQFDGVISSKKRYNFNEKIYDFSSTFLKIGPGLATLKNASYKNLNDLDGKMVGYIDKDALELIEKHPKIFILEYGSIPDALNDLMFGHIDGVLIDSLLGKSYVNNLYYGKIVLGSALTDDGLKLVTLKDEETVLMRIFTKGLKKLQKKNRLQKLKDKWSL